MRIPSSAVAPAGWQDVPGCAASQPLISPGLKEQKLCPCTLASVKHFGRGPKSQRSTQPFLPSLGVKGSNGFKWFQRRAIMINRCKRTGLALQRTPRTACKCAPRVSAGFCICSSSLACHESGTQSRHKAFVMSGLAGANQTLQKIRPTHMNTL